MNTIQLAMAALKGDKEAMAELMMSAPSGLLGKSPEGYAKTILKDNKIDFEAMKEDEGPGKSTTARP